MTDQSVNIVVAGVGGQGNILLSRILGTAAVEAGLSVRIGESFGAAQRGGAVSSHIRIGDVNSPTIPLGKAQVLVGLEPAEALRQSKYLAPQGLAIVNRRRIAPVEVLSGGANYPSLSEIECLLRKITEHVLMVDATGLAHASGDIRYTNVVMLGMLDGLLRLPLPRGLVRQTVAKVVPDSTRKMNLRAFDLGREALESVHVAGAGGF